MLTSILGFSKEMTLISPIDHEHVHFSSVVNYVETACSGAVAFHHSHTLPTAAYSHFVPCIAISTFLDDQKNNCSS